MYMVFGNKPATQAKVAIDSMADKTIVETEMSDSDESVMPRESDPDNPGTSSTCTVDVDDDNQDVKSQGRCQASYIWQKETKVSD